MAASSTDTVTSGSQTLSSCSCERTPFDKHQTLSMDEIVVNSRAAGAHATVDDNGNCLELALEGERLCKAGECRLGVQFLEAAVQAGTDDLKILSAIYSQLGNAHFYLQDYSKALDYHTLDLGLARTMGDKVGEAKASGNLGNTLKVLGKFEEAAVCCLRHLDLTRDLGDKMGEARALYNLGNVYHAQGKHSGRMSQADPGELPPLVRDSLCRAAEYYDANLSIVRELSDRAGVGRACGNLGNTHYLLGNFHEAIRFHTERLAIAKEFGDRGAERRAYSNLGNAHILLGELDTAADHYKRCLNLARQLREPALEAQSCYSLGNTFTLMRDYKQALDYHSRHLHIAEQLGDRIGEARACWSLGNAHTALGMHSKAAEYAERHLAISEEIGDDAGANTARLNLADLRQVLGGRSVADCGTDSGISLPEASKHDDLPSIDHNHHEASTISKEEAIARTTELEIEGLNLTRTGSESSGLGDAPTLDQEAFLDLLSRYQSRRMDEQRCPAPTPLSTQQDDFLDMLQSLQSKRMNDQRAVLPHFPGLRPETLQELQQKQQQSSGSASSNNEDKENLLPDDAFFDMLMRCQATRLDEQRTVLPPPPPPAPTVPEDDVFRSMVSHRSESRSHRLLSKLSLKKKKR